MSERFFILTPTPTNETRPHPIGGKPLPVYHDAEGKPMMWSGEFPIPAIGSRVTEQFDIAIKDRIRQKVYSAIDAVIKERLAAMSK